MATSIPSFANAIAVALPKPLLPPVIIAFLFFKFSFLYYFSIRFICKTPCKVKSFIYYLRIFGMNLTVFYY
ncbi:hypothetical protein BST83_14470 [Polaribacter filamentus]|uniref:Uncharacterized protein n=1 Tax=Polaribacter filamentus TaxID=53483 RepID=A0A2S7KZW8_9FLAO|nr:hypothetical protein BST83_14470 [Polaribacter filamentus]